jgi:5,10-methenyltetrahydromethanopterin hydrogenase
MRERWFGATGRRVPELVLEGDPLVPLDEALVLDDVADEAELLRAHEEGTPVVVRAESVEKIVAALKRPEVASVVVPTNKPELLELDLRELTYG